MKQFKKTYQQRDAAYQLNDSAAYFFDHLDRIAKDDYVPSEADILRARVKTTGIQEAQFTYDDMEFRMLDVGGQRSERRKWIHCFDSVMAVIFCAAMSEYDQYLREDDSQNRMEESLILWKEICNSHWFQNTAMILFLNKVDLFKEKILRVDIKVLFQEYTGGPSFEAASSFIRDKFITESATSKKTVYPHFTCAISTESIDQVFKVVCHKVLKDILGDLGPI